MGFHKWATVLTILLAIILAVSCGCPRCQEPIFLYPTPCTPPCWQNIIPGKTRQDEALQALRASPWVYPDSIKVGYYEHAYTYHGPGAEITWTGYSCVPMGGAIEIPAEGVVERIQVGFSCWGVRGVPVMIDDLIRLYGPPLVQVNALTGGERRTFGIAFAYPHIGFVVDGRFEGTQGVNSLIPREILVESLEYVPPERFAEMARWISCAIPWDGYREASYYCPCPGQHVDPAWCEPFILDR